MPPTLFNKPKIKIRSKLKDKKILVFYFTI